MVIHSPSSLIVHRLNHRRGLATPMSHAPGQLFMFGPHPAPRRPKATLPRLSEEQLRTIAMNAERKLLREVDLFDVYEGDKLPTGTKSYALSFILQDAEKTLTDEQVTKAMDRIRAALEKEVAAELRA